MEFLLYIIVIVIYVIASATGHNGRFLRRHRRFFDLYDLEVQDEYEDLDDIRREYNKTLQIYYEYNKMRMYLLSKFCEAALIKDEFGNTMFYCKERTNGKKPGKYFEVSGDNTHVNTMWGAIDMEFTPESTYKEVRALYYKLNQTVTSAGSLRYFNESRKVKLPKSWVNKRAQNEFCKMEIEQDSDGEKILVCSEIWGETLYNKVRKFIIKGNKLVLYGILADFEKDDNKMKSYTDILAKYSKVQDCEIKELPREEVKTSADKIDKWKPNNEPIKYVHVEPDVPKEKPKQEIKQELKPEPKQEDVSTNIDRYDERNLDL